MPAKIKPKSLLSGARTGQRQVCAIELLHLLAQRTEIAVVHQHIVCLGQPLGSGGLDPHDRFNLLHLLDDPYRIRSPFGKPAEDLDNFYTQARAMVDHPAVAQAFAFSTSDSQRYGSTSFGNACLVAKQVLAASQGTRYIQLTLGGWDHHQDIYDATDGLPPLCKILDDGPLPILPVPPPV